MFSDDGYGVEQALNEPGVDNRGLVVAGRHWLIVEPVKDSIIRSLSQRLLHPATVTFAPYPAGSPPPAPPSLSHTALTRSLPEDVHLLTLERLYQDRVLMRFEHLYPLGEHSVLSRPVQVNLTVGKVYSGYNSVIYRACLPTLMWSQ